MKDMTGRNKRGIRPPVHGVATLNKMLMILIRM